MAVWVLIPVKGFSSSKSRLAEFCDAEERSRLAEAMLGDTLAVVKSVKEISGVALVTAEPIAASIGQENGVLVVDDTASDLNGALSNGRDQIRAKYGRTRLLVLPIDLPALTREDIETVIHAGVHQTSVVIVPDHESNGTNALMLGPDSDMEFAYGPGSFERHLASAKASSSDVTVLSLPKISWDFDNPTDLDQILKFAVGKRASPLLQELSRKKSGVAEKVS